MNLYHKYQKLKNEVSKEVTDNYDMLLVRIDKLENILRLEREDNRNLKEAVEFYAEHENWCQLIGSQYNLGKIWIENNDLIGSITTENGKRARQAKQKSQELRKQIERIENG